MEQFPDALPTRISLIERTSSGRDERAWEELLGYYAPFIRKIILRMGLRGADLDDLQQQVALKLWKGMPSYRTQDDKARFRNWLSTLIRNAVIDWMRSQRRTREVITTEPEAFEHLDPQSPGIEAVIAQEWQNHIVGLAMRNLSEVFSGKAIEVFVRTLKGESVETIAERLDLRRESVYVLRTRVKTRLQHEITRLRFELEGGADD